MSPVSATYWGLSGYVIFWVLFAVAFGLFVRRLSFLFRLMRQGKDENRFDNIGQRIRMMMVEVVPQWCNLKTVTRKDLAGLGHALMFWGFSFFLVSYIIFIGLAGGFGLAHVIEGTAFEKVFLTILDVAGVAVAIAILWAAVRRYIIRPERLEPSAEAAIILCTVFALMVLNVCVVGFNYALLDVQSSWPPIGATLAAWLTGAGVSQGGLDAGYKISWWLHYVLIIGFMVYIPYSKHLHILTSPANVFFRSLGPKMAPQPINFEEAETFGVSQINEFTWKDLLDLYSCAECGRCHVNCPAQLSGKALSPRETILCLKEHLLETGVAKPAAEAGTDGPAESGAKQMIGDVVTEEAIWDCTTCGACQEICPVGVEHVRKMIDLRRNLVLMQSRMPETVQLMLRNMQTKGHPWAGVQSMRLRGDWTSGLDLKILGEGGNDHADTLFWAGCTGALVDRNVQVTTSLVKVLDAAGVEFGVLGGEEACCGDPARRVGYEIQFQTIAEQNIEVFKSYGIKRVITACPHCYNALKNEYPKFGADFEVVHYTRLVADLIHKGTLNPAGGWDSAVTYHDPCYLGRYNEEYAAPRQILQAIPGASIREMERSQSTSLCCGGGGGHMWMEEKTGRKINEIRIEDVTSTGAETVVTSCPYCLQMLEEGIERKQLKSSLRAMDLIELVEKAIN